MQSLGLKFGLLGLGVKAQGLGQKWEARVNIMPHSETRNPKPSYGWLPDMMKYCGAMKLVDWAQEAFRMV